MRTLLYTEAIREALDLAMAADQRVYVMGLGVPDPKAIFGTTAGLQAKYGPQRVFDMPVAENGMTGVAIGSALAGMRPVMVHQRVDFALLALDQIANSAAKWSFLFAGKQSVPLVIRLLIGRGWGQGPQHSQSLQATFAHFPGLKVVMPTSPYDAKGMLLAAIADPNPVVFLEHRWLHSTFGHVPPEHYHAPLSQALVSRPGSDITLVASSLAHIEALQAANILAQHNISAEVLDLRSIQPLDRETIHASLKKTKRLLVVDHGWKSFGVAGEIIASMSEIAFTDLISAPQRVTAPDHYPATTPAHANLYYPGVAEIVNAALHMFKRTPMSESDMQLTIPLHRDVPDKNFRGPF